MSVTTAQISIIMPAYNMAHYIPYAIESAQAQVYEEWELLVLDDGSTDDTSVRVAAYAAQDPRVKLVRHSTNQGLIPILNEGLALATGQFFARLDADDIWLDPHKLAAQRDYLLAHPACGLVGTAATVIDAEGRRTGEIDRPTTDPYIRRHMLLSNPFIHSSVMLRTDFIRSLGGYARGMPHVEDYELWLRVGLRMEMANLPDRWVGYRVSEAGVTSRHNQEQVLRCLQLAWKYRREYPNAWMGMGKWGIQYICVRLLGHRIAPLSKLKLIG